MSIIFCGIFTILTGIAIVFIGVGSLPDKHPEKRAGFYFADNGDVYINGKLQDRQK